MRYVHLVVAECLLHCMKKQTWCLILSGKQIKTVCCGHLGFFGVIKVFAWEKKNRSQSKVIMD